MIHFSRTTAPRQRIAPFLVSLLVGLAIALSGASSPALATPLTGTQIQPATAQNVDWMSADMASRLDIGMDVLIPSWVPAPFTGVEPNVSASSGYYQLYWMIGGGSPTFLYIEGVAGGAMPAGSPADLNKQLTVNASVQGWEAIHDVGIPAGSDTPIYDQVWWIANGVLYTVSSNNMSGSDSLSLANSLVVLQPPAAPPVEAPPVEQPVTESPSEPVGETGEEPASNPGETTTDAPTGDPGEGTGSEPRTVDTGTVSEPAVNSPGTSGTDDPGSATTTTTASTETGDSRSGPWSPDRGSTDVPSDGTNGPLPPVIGGDGTGGWYDNALPIDGPRQ